MWIYMYADEGPAVERDRELLKALPVQHLRIHRLALNHFSVEDLVGRLSARLVTTLILPDQYTRHTWDMNRVKQCALLMDKQVMPLTHFLQMRERSQKKLTANPSELAGQPRLPVAGGIAQPARA